MSSCYWCLCRISASPYSSKSPVRPAACPFGTYDILPRSFRLCHSSDLLDPRSRYTSVCELMLHPAATGTSTCCTFTILLSGFSLFSPQITSDVCSSFVTGSPACSSALTIGSCVLESSKDACCSQALRRARNSTLQISPCRLSIKSCQ